MAFLALYLYDIGWFNAKYIDTIPPEGSIYTSEHDSIRYFKDHPGMYRILQATNTPASYAIPSINTCIMACTVFPATRPGAILQRLSGKHGVRISAGGFAERALCHSAQRSAD